MIINGVRYPRLRRRGARFYYDCGGKPRHWEPLGTDRVKALARYRALADDAKADANTVRRMLADALEDLRGKVAPGTLANYRGYKKHLEAVFVEPPEVINQAQVLRYLNRCPRMSFKGEIAFLSQGFALWMEEGRLTFNPCFGVKTKRKGSKRTRLLTWAEVDRIVDKADERTAVAIELAIALGLRSSDCCALRWTDVAEYLDTQKTGARIAWERADCVEAILARAKALQARVASRYVLCDRRGQRWLKGTLRDHWDAACEAAGVEDAHFHDLRAAAGTEIKKRFGEEAARDFLGHKTLATTQAYLRDKEPRLVRPLSRKA